MYARTVVELSHAPACKDGKISLDLSDELTAAPLVTYEARVVQKWIRAATIRKRSPQQRRTRESRA